MKRGLGINREVILSDLERTRTSLEATVIGITPNNIKILRDKYKKHIGKYDLFNYNKSEYSIDFNGSRILEEEGIVLGENEKPMT
jgi:hypothetical protein